MKTLATLVLLATLASSASAAVVWDESVNGDLSSSAAAPTALGFVPGGNTVTGTVFNSGNVTTGDRDFLTFTIGAGQALVAMNLLAYAPDNLSFAGLNSGATGLVPSAGTNALFLAGIHIGAALVGFDLLPEFDTNSVTTNSLPAPMLGPGTYSFVIQQTNAIVQSYSIDFVLDAPVPANRSTWGKIKALYR